MKKLIAVSALLLALLNLNAQSPTFAWARSWGGTTADHSGGLAVDPLGNVYTIGNFTGVADFDPGPGTYTMASASGTLSDIFVSKLDASGNFVWAKRFGADITDAGTGITVDGSGNIYIIGLFGDTVDFDPGAGTYNLISSGSWDIFVCKLNSAGNFTWARKFGSTQMDEGKSITTDASGNVLTCGYFQGIVDFDPGPGTYTMTSASYDVFVSKLDPNGNFTWAVKMGGSGSDCANSLAVDPSGNIYTTGWFNQTADFDPGAGTYTLTSSGGFESFISKLSPAGAFILAGRIGGSGTDVGNSIKADAAGNIYAAGDFRSAADLDPGAGISTFTSAGVSDAYLCKLDVTGNLLWARQFGSSVFEYGKAVATDNVGNVYITGDFGGTVDFDPGAGTFTLTPSSIDGYVCKLNPSGNFLWAGQIDCHITNHITLDAAANIYLAGSFIGNGDFDPGVTTTTLTSAGDYDVYALKLSQPGNGITETSASGILSLYPNPSSGRFTISLKEINAIDKITITDLLGREVYSASPQTQETEIELIEPGIYFVNVISGTSHIVRKIIIEK